MSYTNTSEIWSRRGKMRKQAIHEHIEFASAKEEEDVATVTAQINMCNGLGAIQQLHRSIFVDFHPHDNFTSLLLLA
jgi:hypothetical protein